MKRERKRGRVEKKQVLKSVSASGGCGGINMKILIFLACAAIMLTVLYFLMIMPRILGGPDMKAFRNWLYAHRGLHNAGAGIPENSLEAFRRAAEAGYGMELDVQVSKDGIPVVFHDFTLKRMCGAEGRICDYTFEELRQFRLLDSEQGIPKLEDVLKLVDGRTPMIVELKIERTDLRVCRETDRLLAEYKGLYCIESFNPLGLFWYRRNRRKVVRGQLSEAFLREKGNRGILYFLLQNLLFNWLTKPDFIAYNCLHPDVASRRLCRSLYGKTAVAWTLRSQMQLEEAGKNFDLYIFENFRPETKRLP